MITDQRARRYHRQRGNIFHTIERQRVGGIQGPHGIAACRKCVHLFFGILAGVSPITASRFFRNPEALSLSKRERVDSAVKELGYVPNLAARALASHRTEVIGVVIPSLTNNVFSDVLRGIYDSSEGSRYTIQLANTRYSILQEEKVLRLAEEHAKVEDGGTGPKVGERREVYPAHCCATMNLHRKVIAVRGGRVEAVWPIEASGRYD